MSAILKDDIDQILNIRILRLASKLSLIFQRETLRPAEIKVQQWRVLVSLAQFGEVHLRALARHSSQDAAHTSRVVKSMIDQGWVKSRADDTDQRMVKYALTEAGTQLIETYWPDAKQFGADISSLFSASEFEQFREMLDRANASCDERLKLS